MISFESVVFGISISVFLYVFNAEERRRRKRFDEILDDLKKGDLGNTDVRLRQENEILKTQLREKDAIILRLQQDYAENNRKLEELLSSKASAKLISVINTQNLVN